MKKEYTRPILYAETFELVEHIASCKTAQQDSSVAIDANYQNPNACHYIDNGFALFNSDVSGCPSDYDSESFGSVQEYIDLMLTGAQCYNAFIDGSFFAS